MPVSSEKERAIAAKMMELGVAENDFEESFVRSSGPGGQKVNKSSSCVYLVHIPTGLAVKCQQERKQKGFIAEEKEKLEKIRRQKRKRSKRAKEKILIFKHQQAEKKILRGKVVIEE